MHSLLEDLPQRMLQPCILVIFGASGDLTSRKLMPALYNLLSDGQLPSNFACIGFSRKSKSSHQFAQEMHHAISLFSRKPIEQNLWDQFKTYIYYHSAEFNNDLGYETLATLMNELDQKLGTKGNRIFYFATPPSYFPLITSKLFQAGLIYNYATTQDKWSRIIIEKPFGQDLASALELQNCLLQYLNEKQLYRIDHYLGKETVQNLLIFRFANTIFEPLWNNQYIDHIQITVAEEQGVASRGKFWEEAGLLRDIIQNHMIQLLTLVAMEAPKRFEADKIRDEKVKVLKNIRPILYEDAVRGQYGSHLDNSNLKAYRQEKDVDPESNVETYAALKIHIDNPRWKGVPFYLRAGKGLSKRKTEIAVIFKKPPSMVYHQQPNNMNPNLLVIRIQPNEGASLEINCKVPGPLGPIQNVKMDFQYGTYFGKTSPEAYERLIFDAILGDSTLFAREDEVIESWKLLSPLLELWKNQPPIDFPNYSIGSEGPKSSEDLIAEDKRQWRLISQS